jgi:hypothetical protein
MRQVTDHSRTVGPMYGTELVLAFWRLEYGGGFYTLWKTCGLLRLHVI